MSWVFQLCVCSASQGLEERRLIKVQISSGIFQAQRATVAGWVALVIDDLSMVASAKGQPVCFPSHFCPGSKRVNPKPGPDTGVGRWDGFISLSSELSPEI